jgi:NAD(P)H dehydrogenase (quinone)
MKIFIVFAHPETRSFNGALLRVAVEELESQGHEVRVSDLYAMKWKSHADREDFPHLPADARLRVAQASAEATAMEALTDDVKAEQEKLLWADTVIFHFPLWWYSMPAIMKGWFDRVYSCGWAYGVGKPTATRWSERYGEGVMLGKRAMLIVPVGGWKEHYSARGITGPIDDVLYHINHGMLYYTGFEVLPSLILYRIDKCNDEDFGRAADELRERLRALSTTEPIAYRSQNGGEYTIPELMLKPGLESSKAEGFSLHTR